MAPIFGTKSGRRSCTLLLAGSTTLALLMGSAAAYADDAPSNSLVEVVEAATPETVAAAAAVATQDDTGHVIDATLADTNLTVPVDPADGITLDSESGRVKIELPFATEAGEANVEKPGIVSYDNGNGSVTVPVVQPEGDIQINTVISGEASPTRYAYPLTLPEGAVLEQNSDGSIVAWDPAGEIVLTLSAPWAKDANGLEVPTRYEVAGNTVTQVVEHSSAFAYPIVADPYAGNGQFYKKAWVSGAPKGYKGYVVNAIPTSEGRRLNDVNVLGVHLRQLKSKLGGNASKVTPTIREQFYCHVVGNIFEPGTYNMESWRKYKDWGTQLNLWDRCNP